MDMEFQSGSCVHGSPSPSLIHRNNTNTGFEGDIKTDAQALTVTTSQVSHVYIANAMSRVSFVFY